MRVCVCVGGGEVDREGEETARLCMTLLEASLSDWGLFKGLAGACTVTVYRLTHQKNLVLYLHNPYRYERERETARRERERARERHRDTDRIERETDRERETD